MKHERFLIECDLECHSGVLAVVAKPFRILRVQERRAGTVTGLTAVALWKQYLKGDYKALRRLILYNRSDVAAMGAMLDEVIRKMNARYGSSMPEVGFRDWSAPPGWRTLSNP